MGLAIQNRIEYPNLGYVNSTRPGTDDLALVGFEGSRKPPLIVYSSKLIGWFSAPIFVILRSLLLRHIYSRIFTITWMAHLKLTKLCLFHEYLKSIMASRFKSNLPVCMDMVLRFIFFNADHCQQNV